MCLLSVHRSLGSTGISFGRNKTWISGFHLKVDVGILYEVTLWDVISVPWLPMTVAQNSTKRKAEYLRSIFFFIFFPFLLHSFCKPLSFLRHLSGSPIICPFYIHMYTQCQAKFLRASIFAQKVFELDVILPQPLQFLRWQARTSTQTGLFTQAKTFLGIIFGGEYPRGLRGCHTCRCFFFFFPDG